MLRANIDRYIALQQAMGFKFRTQSGLLNNYVGFAESLGETYVRCQSVLRWAEQAPSPAQRRNRLLTVRRFAITMQAEDARYQIPPADAFGRECAQRKIRHLFTAQDIQRLLAASAQLHPVGSIRPITYTTLFALLAATGLRISEAIALGIDDVTEDGLIIRSTKFRKDRLVPLHDSARRGIRRYMDHRSLCAGLEPALLVSRTGQRLAYSTVNSIFLQLVRRLGMRGGPGTPGVCIHDLRHTFAVRSLEQCKGRRTEVSRHMLALSTYLGHAHISDTYWYLQATPALLGDIATAQEACYGRQAND